MKITEIPLQNVKDAISSARERFTEQTTFNTHFHSPEELPSTIPKVTPTYNGSPFVPLGPWLDLIAESQQLDKQCIHRVQLRRSYCAVLLAANVSTDGSGSINPSDEEDLEDLFPQQTMNGVSVKSLFDDAGNKEHFMRLDTTSLKDAVYQSRREPGTVEKGSEPLTHLWQIWRRLATSKRGLEGVRDLTDRDKDVVLYLLPWRPKFSTKREYRVFCPPCLPHPARISAISQYKWYRPWHIFGPEFFDDMEIEYTAGQVLEGAKAIHCQIIEAVKDGDGLKEHGFTFDVFHAVEGDVELIELNPFGAMSGCGSCLFHWIKDAEVLYQSEEEGIEFRVCRADKHEFETDDR